MLPELCLGLMLLGVTAYAIFGSADFGAGFWDLTAGTAHGGARVRGLIQRSMSPVWEANHVWLIFVLVIAWTAFPVAFGSIFFVTWWRRKRLPRSRLFYRAVMLAGPLSLVALIAGWITTEVGRQPWIVYEVMRTSQAVTAADNLEIGYATLIAVYLSLGAAVGWLLRRLSAKPPGQELKAGRPDEAKAG